MKKLSVLFAVLCIFVSGLSAKPVIPKISNYIYSLNTYSPENVYVYIDNSGTNEYKIFSVIDENKSSYQFYFINKSYLTDVEIILHLYFKDGNSLDEFCNVFDTLDLTIEFEYLREIILKNDVTPIIQTSSKNRIECITYTVEYNSISTDSM